MAQRPRKPLSVGAASGNDHRHMVVSLHQYFGSLPVTCKRTSPEASRMFMRGEITLLRGKGGVAQTRDWSGELRFSPNEAVHAVLQRWSQPPDGVGQGIFEDCTPTSPCTRRAGHFFLFGYQPPNVPRYVHVCYMAESHTVTSYHVCKCTHRQPCLYSSLSRSNSVRRQLQQKNIFKLPSQYLTVRPAIKYSPINRPLKCAARPSAIILAPYTRSLAITLLQCGTYKH